MIEKSAIERATKSSVGYAEAYRKQLKKYDEDGQKERRLKNLSCKTCWYMKGGVATQAFTTFICKGCGNKHMHPNGNTPIFCRDCALENDICVGCGSSL